VIGFDDHPSEADQAALGERYLGALDRLGRSPRARASGG
jgi:hypothetical protein